MDSVAAGDICTGTRPSPERKPHAWMRGDAGFTRLSVDTSPWLQE